MAGGDGPAPACLPDLTRPVQAVCEACSLLRALRGSTRLPCCLAGPTDQPAGCAEPAEGLPGRQLPREECQPVGPSTRRARTGADRGPVVSPRGRQGATGPGLVSQQLGQGRARQCCAARGPTALPEARTGAAILLRAGCGAALLWRAGVVRAVVAVMESAQQRLPSPAAGPLPRACACAAAPGHLPLCACWSCLSFGPHPYRTGIFVAQSGAANSQHDEQMAGPGRSAGTTLLRVALSVARCPLFVAF